MHRGRPGGLRPPTPRLPLRLRRGGEQEAKGIWSGPAAPQLGAIDELPRALAHGAPVDQVAGREFKGQVVAEPGELLVGQAPQRVSEPKGCNGFGHGKNLRDGV